MRRIPLYGTILIVALTCILTVPSMAQTSKGLLGFNAVGAGLFPVNGKFDATDDLKDATKTGAGLEFSVKYWINNRLGIEGSYMYSWNRLKYEKIADPTTEPAFVSQGITINGIYNLLPQSENGSRFVPYVMAGIGVFPWKFTMDGRSGDAMMSPVGIDEFSKTSFGWNTGAGLEVFLVRDLSLFAQVNYQYIYSEDKDKFGPDFGNQGLLQVGGGLSYYFQLLK